MDSSRIKNLAFGARDALRAEVSARLDAVLAEGSAERAESREEVARIERAVRERGRDAVVEENAYTWFNRLCALRYMDARGYTPVSIVTPREGATQPALLADAAQGSFDPELEVSAEARVRVSGLLSGGIPSHNATEEAYAELLLAACERYARPMPYLFDSKQASALLMPQGLLSESSILRRIASEMDDESCAEGVEILGWLYQFYIAERKDAIYASKKKREAADIGPVTQLFTPNWIVRYLAENSLGCLWMLNNPGSELVSSMDYYIAPEESEDALEVASADEVKVLDPACGSGHILVYAFDLLFKMYEEEGWLPEDIPAMILENNLFGFEIDPRAAEIASFALEMKARERDPRFFEKGVDAKVTVLRPVRFDEGELEGAGMLLAQKGLLDAFEHLDEVGSLYVPEPSDILHVDAAIAGVERNAGMFAEAALEKLRLMRDQLEALSMRFHCVIANPPYMGRKDMNAWLSKWVEAHYLDEKGDLCTCFTSRNMSFAMTGGYSGQVITESPLFISSFETFRAKMIDVWGIRTLAQVFDARKHADNFSANAMFVLGGDKRTPGHYFRLGQNGDEAKKEAFFEALADPDCGWFYRADSEDFKKIPGSPIAYWVCSNAIAAYKKFGLLKDYSYGCNGFTTGDNELFLRRWWEISFSKMVCADEDEPNIETISGWVPYNKGGEFRKWFGNRSYVINWINAGAAINSHGHLVPRSKKYQLRQSLSWSKISSGKIAVRKYDKGTMFDVAGLSLFAQSGESSQAIEAFINSSVADVFLSFLSPTLNFEVGNVTSLPISERMFNDSNLLDLAKSSENISRIDYDTAETSWGYELNPLIGARKIAESYSKRKAESESRFAFLKECEEKLNQIFAEIYGMVGEVPTEVEDKYVSVARIFDYTDDIPESFKGNKYVRTKQDEVKSLISYAVGCMLGRYSLDEPGLILTDQGATIEDYLAKVPEPAFMPDEDNVLPILDGEWFEDDIVAGIRRWLAAAYGEETLEENVAFIEEALGKDLRTYLVKDFYADHVKTYQKRPIYWLFQSPKKSFQCLVYMHRYDAGTVGDVLTKYLRPYQEKLTSKAEALERSDSARDAREAVKLRSILDELSKWEREVVYPLAHERVEIDLDDGVKVNYNKFPRALAKVTGLSEWK